MTTRKFTSAEEVIHFVEKEYDFIMTPVVEEYLSEADGMINVGELNGWIEHEYLEMSADYEKWIDETYVKGTGYGY
jgi:hypothetical protein